MLSGGKEAASPYREGNSGKQMAQGESLAMVANPLAVGESLGRQTSHRKSRETNGRSGWGNLVHTRGESQWSSVVEAYRLSAETASPGVYSEVQRQIATAGDSDNEGPGDASAASTCIGASLRNHGGP